MQEEDFNVPVVLFTFRRLDIVKMILERLAEIEPKTVYIFSDGARIGRTDEQEKVQNVRNYLDSAITWECSCHKEYAKENKGCAKNIRSGVDYVFAREKKAIILEDDVVPMKEFFKYCEILLDKYENDKRIQYIAGFNAIGDNEFIQESYCFAYTAPMSGAIATWADRWNECNFSLPTWSERKKNKTFRKYFYTNELYHQICKSFDEAQSENNEGWDYQFMYNQLENNRFAIVPKGNLTSNIGFSEEALHTVSDKKALKMQEILRQTSRKFEFPMESPKHICENVQYSKLRQKYFLSVNGNYVQRHWKYLILAIKDFMYHHLPSSVWNFGKKLIKK